MLSDSCLWLKDGLVGFLLPVRSFTRDAGDAGFCTATAEKRLVSNHLESTARLLTNWLLRYQVWRRRRGRFVQKTLVDIDARG